MLKNTVTELKNILEVLISRLDETEEWIRDLEDRAVELTQTEQQKEKKNVVKCEDSFETTSIRITFTL